MTTKNKNIDVTNVKFTERNNNLEQYFNNIRKYENLTTDEQIELAEKIQNGDEKAKEKLIKHNLKFVVSVAKKYTGQGLDLMDLINEGNIGLIRAAANYKQDKGYKFITYAVWWIRQAIISAIAEKGRIYYIPANQPNNINKINKSKEKLRKKLGREPTIYEISKDSGLNEQQVKIVNNIISKDKYLEDNINDDDDEENTLINTIENENTEKPNETVENNDFKKEINLFLNNVLDQRSKEIVIKLFGIDTYEHSINEISEHYQLTEERVRQIKRNAIEKLSKSKNKKLFKAFL